MSQTTRTLERSGPKLTGRAALLLVIVASLVLLAAVPARTFLDQRGRIADLERRAADLEAQNDDLRSELTRLHDPAELERLARECLGMVSPGEIVLVVPEARAARADC